jgi:peptidoglycan hydrolase-like protein with peptidoglycan-binding domain
MPEIVNGYGNSNRASEGVLDGLSDGNDKGCDNGEVDGIPNGLNDGAIKAFNDMMPFDKTTLHPLGNFYKSNTEH